MLPRSIQTSTPRSLLQCEVEALAFGCPEFAAAPNSLVGTRGVTQGIQSHSGNVDHWPRFIYLYIMNKAILLPCLLSETPLAGIPWNGMFV